MEIPNIGSWLAPGELLVTTGYAIQNADTGLANLIQDLHAANAAGLAIKTRFIGSVPENAIQAAEHLNIPLLEVPSDMAFTGFGYKGAVNTKGVLTHYTIFNLLLFLCNIYNKC